MNKAKVNYWVDFLALLSFLVCGITGIIKLQPIMRALGMHYRDPIMMTFTKIHDLSGVLLVILIIIHFILHWDWITAMTKSIFKKNK